MTISVNPEMRELLLTTMPTLVSYVETLAGSREAVMQWRILPERPGVEKQPGEYLNRRGTIRDWHLVEWLLQKNQAGYAVFCSINEYPNDPIRTRGAGKKHNITRMRCAHVDIDIAKAQCPPGWQHGMLADGENVWVPRLLLPTMQVESVGGPHLYWVYRTGEEPSVEEGEGINRALQNILNSDPGTCDASRILRVPGFYHWKTGEPRRVQLAFNEPLRRFSAQEMKDCIDSLGVSFTPSTPRILRVREHGDDDVEPVEMTKEEYQRAFNTALDFIMKRSPTEKGERGSTLIKVICPRLHDLGIITPHALKLLRIWADQKVDQTPSADGEWPATDEMLKDRWLRSEEARETPRGSQIYEWRGGLSSEFDDPPEAASANDRQRRVRESTEAKEASRQYEKAAAEAQQAEDAVEASEAQQFEDAMNAAAQQAAQQSPKENKKKTKKQKASDDKKEEDAKEEDEDAKEDVPDEPEEDWIEAARLERAGTGMLPVPIRKQHGITVNEVLAVLARHPDLYQFDGKIVHIRHTTTGWRIREVTKNSVITYATGHCAFFKFKFSKTTEEWTTQDCGPPTWLAGEVIDSHRFQAFRHLKGLTAIPRIRSDGTVSQPGYDPETCTVYIPDEELENIHVGETREEALKAVAFLSDVVRDFPLVGAEQLAAVLGAMLTPFCRRALDGPAPMFMIDGNRPNIGKSYLLKVITSMFGHDVAPLNWAPSDRFGSNIYQNTQRISSAFLSGRCIIALDNLKGEFGDVVIDKLLTQENWSERILGTSENFTVENFMTVLGTANNITLVSDVWRRVVPIRLVVADVASRPQPRHELATYLPTVRKKMIEACLTILRAFCVAGRPQGATMLGSFEKWSRWVASSLVWLGLPDITHLVGTPEDALEDTREQVEQEVVIHAVAQVCNKLGKESITSSEFVDVLEDIRMAAGVGSPVDAVTGELQEMVSLLLRRGIRPGQKFTSADVGAMLRRFRDNTVRDEQGNLKMLVVVKDPGRRKPSTWKVVPLGQAIDVIAPSEETKQ